MLSQRMDKLEADLELLITMHDLFLQSDTESMLDETDMEGRNQGPHRRCYPNDDVPERDVTKIHSNRNNSKEKLQEREAIKVIADANSTTDRNSKIASSDNVIFTEDANKVSLANFEKEIEALKDQVSKEKSLRAEVEESAKHVYIQLHKVQDDLKHEKEMKEALLLESLELKNLIQTCRTQRDNFKSKLDNFQVEVQQLVSKVQTVTTEKANLFQRLAYLCQDLGLNRCVGKSGGVAASFLHPTMESIDRTSTICYVELLKTHIQELRKRCNNRGSSDEQIRKLTGQLNTAVGRCATLEKERDKTKLDLTQTQERENHLKNQLYMCQMTVASCESDMLKKQIEYECTLQKLQSESHLEKDKFDAKMLEYSCLIKKSKELLLHLRDERDQSRKGWQDALESKNGLHRQIKMLTEERHKLLHETEHFKKKLGEVSNEKWEKRESWQMEKMSLEMSLRKSFGEKRKCMELLSQMKMQLLNLKSKHEHASTLFQMERDKITSENKRLDENFRVLQKVSEDQGQTITKLRNEMDQLKTDKFKLDNQIREYQATENQLIKKLSESEKQDERYLRYIDELEEKLHKYSEELKTHDCDEFVNSKYKSKVEEIEEKLRMQMKEWQLSLEELKSEKEEAVGNSKSVLEKMHNMKRSHEAILTQVKTKLEADLKRTTESYRKQDEENGKKILELQSQIDRVKISSYQIQQALSQKIKQLQAALGICLGNGSSMGSAINNLQAKNNTPMMFGGGYQQPQTFHHNHPATTASNLFHQYHPCYTFPSGASGGGGGGGGGGGQNSSTNGNNGAHPPNECCSSSNNNNPVAGEFSGAYLGTGPDFGLNFIETLNNFI